MTKKNKSTFTVDEIVTFLKDEAENETIEGQLLRRQLIRKLYKQIGEPREEDFPEECKIAGSYWNKMSGYTNDIKIMTARNMEMENNSPTLWRITYPSPTKRELEDEYTRAGWSCEVQAYNVLCEKYVKHPRYENIWVRFYSSRDCNKYEYVIETEG